jgi:hypothetical protein
MTHAAASQPAHLTLEQSFQTRIQILAITLRHSTLNNYRCTVQRFLSYLDAEFPQVRRLSQLRRDPHLLGWFRSLCEQHRPLSNKTRQQYMLCLRRLFDDLAHDGSSLRPASFSPMISLRSPSTFPSHSPRKRTNGSSKNSAVSTTCTPMRCCSPGLRESVLENASI